MTTLETAPMNLRVNPKVSKVAKSGLANLYQDRELNAEIFQHLRANLKHEGLVLFYIH